MHAARQAPPMNLIASVALKAFYGVGRFDLLSLNAAGST
jgi:hypothetical protein